MLPVNPRPAPVAPGERGEMESHRTPGHARRRRKRPSSASALLNGGAHERHVSVLAEVILSFPVANRTHHVQMPNPDHVLARHFWT